MIRVLSCAVAFAAALAASPSFACMGKTVLFADSFREPDDKWGAEGEAAQLDDGRIKVKANANAAYKLRYSGMVFADADICATLRTPNDLSTANEPYAGIMFWAQDDSNFYVWQISAVGTASLWRQVKGKWVNVLDWRNVEALKKGAGQRNILRVVITGQEIDLYANDVKIAVTKGQPPAGGGEIGFFAASERTKRDAWKFSDLKVTKPDS